MLHYFCAIKTKLSKTQKQLNYQIIQFLINRGADIAQKTLKDQTATDLLASHCNKENILVLFQSAKDRNLSANSMIPKHNVKKLGDEYFKRSAMKSDKH